MYLKKFIRNLAIYSLAVGIITFVLWLVLPENYITPALPWIYLFFVMLTLVLFLLLSRSLEGRFSRFVNTYMIATVLKLLLMIIILVVYVILNKQDAVAFLITFFIMYILFTAFEVVSFYSISKK